MKPTFTTISLIASIALLGGMEVACAQVQPVTDQDPMVLHQNESNENRYAISLGLSGYSPVSYIENNQAEPGSPLFSAEHAGITYFFVNERQLRTFNQNPEKFLPAFGGYCAFGCSVDSKFIPDPTNFEVIDGRTHLFLKNANLDARSLWNDADKHEVREKAERFWMSQSKSKAYINGRNVPASGIGLDGFSPVSYFTAGIPQKGDPRFAVEHNGVTYYLTSASQVEIFTQDPSRYEPQCGGWCAFGMTVEDKFPIDPTKYRIIDDRLYLFLNNEEINAFDLWGQSDQRELLRKAHDQWSEVSGQ